MNRRLYAGALLAVAAYLAAAWPTRASMVDDAYVSLRYARHLALGNGLVFNAGEPPVEGYTNFLWVLWMAPGTVLPLHPSTWATGWGLAFGALALVCAVGIGTVLCGRGSPWALLPAAVLAPLPVYAVATTNGLETAMYLATLLGAAWALLDGRRPLLGGALAGLLYLVRPEGIAAAGVLVAAAALRDRHAGRRALLPAVAAAAVVVPYFAARAAYFGTLGPNTFAAQARKPFLEMFEMNAPYYAQSAELYAGATLALVVSALAALRGGRDALPRLAVVAVAAGLALVAMRVYNWMPGARLFLPSIALTACALAPTLQRLAPTPRAVALLTTLGWVGWLAVGPPRAVETRYDRRHTALPGNEAERMGRAIAEMAPPPRDGRPWLLARDAGVVPYFAGPDVNVIDIHPHSLTDPRLTGKRFDYDYLVGRDLAFIVTTATTADRLPTVYSQERLLLRHPRVAGRFRQVSVAKQHHRRLFALWVRDDLAPPGELAAPVAAPRGTTSP